MNHVILVLCTLSVSKSQLGFYEVTIGVLRLVQQPVSYWDICSALSLVGTEPRQRRPVLI